MSRRQATCTNTLTILKTVCLVDKSIIRELGQHWCDHVDAAVQYYQTIHRAGWSRRVVVGIFRRLGCLALQQICQELKMGELHGESRAQTCLQQHDRPCLLSWETNHDVSEEFPEPAPSRKRPFHLRPKTAIGYRRLRLT